MASEFGKRLAQAREHAGLTQIELAAKVPMAQSTLASAESGGDGSRLTVQIARVCGVDPYWLATGEGDMLAGTHQAPVKQQRVDLSAALPVVLDAIAGCPERAELERLLPLLVTGSSHYRQRLTELLEQFGAEREASSGKRAA